MSLTLLRRAAQKPPIGPLKLDIGHPLTFNLLSFWVMHEFGSTTINDSVSGNNFTIQRQTATDGQWTGSPSVDSPAVHTLGNSSTAAYLSTGVTTQFNPGSQDFTVALAFRKLAGTTGSAFNNIWGFNNWTTTPNKAWALLIGDGVAGNTDQVEFDTYDGTNTKTAQSSAALALNTPHVIVGVRQGSNLRVYADGVQVGSATGVGTTLVNPTSASTVIGNTNAGGATANQNPNAEWYWASFWMGRALSASDVAQLTAQPYAMFQTRPMQRWFTIAAAAGAPVGKSLRILQAVNRAATY